MALGVVTGNFLSCRNVAPRDHRGWTDTSKGGFAAVVHEAPSIPTQNPVPLAVKMCIARQKSPMAIREQRSLLAYDDYVEGILNPNEGSFAKSASREYADPDFVRYPFDASVRMNHRCTRLRERNCCGRSFSTLVGFPENGRAPGTRRMGPAGDLIKNSRFESGSEIRLWRLKRRTIRVCDGLHSPNTWQTPPRRASIRSTRRRRGVISFRRERPGLRLLLGAAQCHRSSQHETDQTQPSNTAQHDVYSSPGPV